MSGKTQVFVVGFDDHCRTRLTHTLEVSQIATTISKNLSLNVDLTEAIALGHDVGHTPFGHVGERFLNLLMNGYYDVRGFNSELSDDKKGFKHNLQSLRVVTTLEKHRKNKQNVELNLTNYTRWGLFNHTKVKYNKCTFLIKKNSSEHMCGYMQKNTECKLKGEFLLCFYNQQINKLKNGVNWTYEAFVVAMADEIAQRHHDIEDGIEANIIKKDELITKIKDILGIKNDKQPTELTELYNEEIDLLSNIEKVSEKEFYLPLLNHFIVSILTKSLINNARKKLNELKIKIEKRGHYLLI